MRSVKTNFEWRKWGEEDPLFGVLSTPGRENTGLRPWTDEEFYARGSDWSDFLVRWERYGLIHGTIVEVGCGAGRITWRLAKCFDSVIACDVSEGMLSYARERIPDRNIDWKLSDGATLPAQSGTVDAVFSCHVFQHFADWKAQLDSFREVFRVLRGGGTFLIHIPIHAFPWPNRAYTRLARIMYRLFLAIANAKAWLRRMQVRFGGRGYMHGVSHELEDLYAALLEMGFANVEFQTFPVSGRLHTCVVGTKP